MLFCLGGFLFLPKSQHKRELILLYGVAALVFLFTSREPYAAERVR